MAVNLSPIGNGQQFFDNTGLPLNGGLLYTYQAGSTTALATFTTIAGTIQNANPIVLNSSGRLTDEIWLTYGYYYKFVLATATNTTIATYDNIYGIIGVQASAGTTIPTGLISIWYGSIGSVPSGWYLCDGTNGTPDLRDRFVVGAGSTYSVSATGGATSATLVTGNLPSHTHTYSGTTATGGGSHSHPLSPNVWDEAAGLGFGLTSSGNYVNRLYSTGTTDISHTHTYSGTTDTTGSGTSFSLLNPYYALAYIMKS